MASAHSEFEELRIVLLGNTGVGKSATTNVLIGRDTFKETETRECEIQHGRVKDRNISVIDTPGINNTSIAPEQMRDQTKKCMLLSSPGPHVFLLVIRLGGFTEDERDAVKWIQENFGEEALMFTMVLFTGKEEMAKRQLNKYFQDESIQRLISSCGGGYDVINSKREVNPAQITKLLEKIEDVIQLNGGKFYTDEMYQKAQRKTREKEDNERIKREENKRREREENERIKRELNETRERQGNERTELTRGITERGEHERIELSRGRIERGENERKEREKNERIKRELNETSERQRNERTELSRGITERGEHERIELSRGRIERVENERIVWSSQRIEKGENEIIELITGSTERKKVERMELSRERIERGENERKEREENEQIKRELNETSERQRNERTELTRGITERVKHERIELSRRSTEKRRGKRIEREENERREREENERIDCCRERTERRQNERREIPNTLSNTIFLVAGIASLVVILVKVILR